MLVLEPIFEADLQPEQYAYRPERSANDAVKRVHKLLNTGYNEVVDCDLSNYFGEIPHAELMKSITRKAAFSQCVNLASLSIGQVVVAFWHDSLPFSQQGLSPPSGRIATPCVKDTDSHHLWCCTSQWNGGWKRTLNR